MLRRILSRNLANKRLILPIEFLLKMSLVYIGWRCFKYVAESNEGFLWGGWFWLKNTLGNSITTCAAYILQAANYTLFYEGRTLILQGTNGIYFADLCLGVAPMVIFTGFILSYGTNFKNKLWFIPLGIFLIFCINVVRVVALALIQLHLPHYFQLAHSYLYVLITYGLIFILVMWWMNKLADNKIVVLQK